MKKAKPFFRSPLWIVSHIALITALLLWFNPLTNPFLQPLDEMVFQTFNGNLVNKPFWQVFWGLLNDRRETKLNLLFAALINIWAILATQEKALRYQRIKQTVYFWICFQIGFMLQEGIFNSWLHIARDSPSLVIKPAVKLSQVLQNFNLKEGTQHSFPSGHAFSLIYWASFTLFCAPRRIGMIALFIAILLCLPRLFIGAHWLSDEVFSVLMALVWLSWTVNNPIYHKIILDQHSKMDIYPPAFVHGNIQEVLPNIFFVTGACICEHEGKVIQKSNNMVIVRDGKELTLINTFRLNEDGLKIIDKLGNVTNIVRLGAFHDTYDVFYLNRYKAKFWAVRGMIHENNESNRQTDFLIGETDKTPFPDVSFFKFETTSQPEAIMHIARQGGILITCDSIKNWTKIDEYFSENTAQEFLEHGLIKPVSIDKVWLGAMSPKNSDFARLKKLSFRHLLSAHGQPIIDTASEQLMPVLESLSK